MKKRLLTLNDLYLYYVSQNKNINFNSNVEHSQIIVQMPGKIVFNKRSNDTEGLLPVHLQANHTKKNLNGSNIDDEVCLKALPSFSNRPILGYLHKVNDQWEFYGHNMHEDENGNIEYDEFPIGIIPESSNAQLVYDKHKKKNFVEIDGFIFEEYSHAAEVLEREEECSVSVELSIRELSYNAKEKFLDIKDYYYSGVTILGKDDDGNVVNPGMEGSNIRMADFSRENNSLMNDIDEKLDNFFNQVSNFLNNIDTTRKEEAEMENEEIFEEVTDTEEVTVETTEESTEEVTVEEMEITDDNTPEVVIENSVEKVEPVNLNEKYVKSFEISHEDIRYGLYNLLSSYEEMDNDWYWITNVYDSHFVYENCNGTKIYGQNYTKDGDNISFDGDRWELYKELLTASEKTEIENMRSNYESLKEYKLNNELQKTHAEREAIMNDEKYSMISNKIEKDGEQVFENESYAALFADMDKYSCSELEEKLKAIIGEYALKGNLVFSSVNKEKKNINKVNILVTDTNSNDLKTKNRYGDLFDGIL